MTPEVVSELATIADICWAVFYVVLVIAVCTVLRFGWLLMELRSQARAAQEADR